MHSQGTNSLYNVHLCITRDRKKVLLNVVFFAKPKHINFRNLQNTRPAKFQIDQSKRTNKVPTLITFVIIRVGKQICIAKIYNQNMEISLKHPDLEILLNFLWSAMGGRLNQLHANHTSNSGFDQTFMPCSSHILLAAEQRVGYQI